MGQAERLKAWLKAAGITQAELARRCGYDRHNFNRVLAGTLKPTVALALAVERETNGLIPADALNADVAKVRSAA